MSGKLEDALRSLIEPIVQSYNLQLWGLRYRVGSNTAHLQIFIEGENGVDAGVCGDITNALSPILDSADLIEPAYILEVSSPGVDRILFSLEQFYSYIGQNIKLELKLACQGRRKLVGKLSAIDESGTLTIEEKDSKEVFSIAYENIALARIVPDFASLMQAKK